MCICLCMFVFFFKQKTAYEMRISDWSSDVCSSDLAPTMAKVYIRISDSPENSRELEWFLQRYPMVFQPESIIDRLTAQAIEHRDTETRLAEIGRASCRERVCQYV